MRDPVESPVVASLREHRGWRAQVAETLTDHTNRFNRLDGRLDDHAAELAKLRAQVGVWAAAGAVAASLVEAVIRALAG